jgi:cell pole-organizing protein PopZ
MNDDCGEQEPSMEEILSSIRKIISEDNDEGGEAPEPQAPPAPEPEPELEVEEEPLELTDESDDELELTDEIEEEPLELEEEVLELEAESEPLPPMELEPIEEQMAVVDALISPTAEVVSTAAFSQLAQSLTGRNVPLGRADRSLEQLVKELMRPMLREWLDENLPAVVEEVVKREVQRMANAAKDN